MADQRVAIEQLQSDDDDRAGDHRQPELLIEAAARESKMRGNGCGSVLHSIAANCWTISASASVEST